MSASCDHSSHAERGYPKAPTCLPRHKHRFGLIILPLRRAACMRGDWDFPTAILNRDAKVEDVVAALAASFDPAELHPLLCHFGVSSLHELEASGLMEALLRDADIPPELALPFPLAPFSRN